MHDDDKKEWKSDEDNSEGDKKAKAVSFKNRAISAGNKFRRSLRRKRRRRVGDHVASIEDIRDVKELEAVQRFHQCLHDEGLLPERHDDYHVMLRCNFFLISESQLLGFLLTPAENSALLI